MKINKKILFLAIALFLILSLYNVYSARAEQIKSPLPLTDNLLIPSDYERVVGNILPTGFVQGPESEETSLFMIGDVSVAVVFIESNGTIDQNKENWSQSRMDQVISNIHSGLDWWASQEPKAKITWTYHTYYNVPTSYEPITHPSSDWNLWIDEAMDYLGYPGNSDPSECVNRVRNYANNLRNSDGTDWAFVIFVVDSSNDSDGLFSDGYYGLGWLSGPMFLITYNYTNDKTTAHETGHVFQALDEYCSLGYFCCRCYQISGFLRVLNLNCTAGCPEGNCNGGKPDCNGCDACYTSGCIMDNLSGCLTSSTRNQVGWRDEDMDGILDACDSTYNNWIDSDGDGYVDFCDNCPYVYNPDQKDSDKNGIGDACEFVTTTTTTTTTSTSTTTTSTTTIRTTTTTTARPTTTVPRRGGGCSPLTGSCRLL
jgi:hypothetical protein